MTTPTLPRSRRPRRTILTGPLTGIPLLGRTLAAALALAATLVFVAPAAADPPLTLSIFAPTNVQIYVPMPGHTINDSAWIVRSVDLGNVDGSGFDSLAVDVSSTDPTASGVYVVFGSAIHRGGMIDVTRLGSDGYKIGTQPAATIANVGDLNADGLPDLALSMPTASNNGIANSGSVFVVYSKSTDTPVDLTNLGNQGFRIDGPGTPSYSTDAFGTKVALLTDANADGRSALLISNPTDHTTNSDPNMPGTGGGVVYAIYAQAAGSVLDLSHGLAANGFEIESGSNMVANMLGATAAIDAGDQNGDGLHDVAVTGTGSSQGASDRVAIVDNPGPGGVVDVASPGGDQFRFTLSPSLLPAGISAVTNMGDLNGDGRDDFAVGAGGVSKDGRNSNGAVWVVYSPMSGSVAVDTVVAAKQGYEVDGAVNGAFVGAAVFNAGDQNQDGINDLLIANGSTVNPRGAFLIHTPSAGTVIDLANLPVGAGTVYECFGGVDSMGLAGNLNSDGIPALFMSGGGVGAEDANGMPLGHSVTIVGSAPPPVVSTDPQTLAADAPRALPGTARRAVGGTAASASITLRGTVSEPLGEGIPTSVPVASYYQYGTTTSYGQTTATQVNNVAAAPVAVAAQVSGLKSGVLYHYRLVAVNDRGGLTYESDHTVLASVSAGPTAVIHLTHDRTLRRFILDGSASKAAPGRALKSYTWTLKGKVIGRRARFSYTFPRAAQYTVTLTVADDRGQSGVSSAKLDTHEHMQTVTVTLPASTLFRGDTAALTAAGKRRLKRLAPAIAAAAQVVVDGYSDAKPPAGQSADGYNRALSRKQAHAVAAVLIGRRVPGGLHLQLHGYGRARLAERGSTSNRRARNERIVIRYTRVVRERT